MPLSKYFPLQKALHPLYSFSWVYAADVWQSTERSLEIVPISLNQTATVISNTIEVTNHIHPNIKLYDDDWLWFYIEPNIPKTACKKAKHKAAIDTI